MIKQKEHWDGNQVTSSPSGPQFPFWTRSGLESGGFLKSFEDFFDQAHTAFGILMSSTRNLFPRITSVLLSCIYPHCGLWKHLSLCALMSSSLSVLIFSDSM